MPDSTIMSHCNGKRAPLPQQTLPSILAHAATTNQGLFIYATSDVREPHWLSYNDLFVLGQQNAIKLRTAFGITNGTRILLHCGNHLDNVVWFWSIVLAGAIPAMSTPLTNDEQQRLTHLDHVRQVLETSICITRRRDIEQVFSNAFATSVAIEDIDDLPMPADQASGSDVPKDATLPLDQLPGWRAPDEATAAPDDALSSAAFFMLTSGSTGNAKFVGISASQVLSSISGKRQMFSDAPGTSYLNWVGMDHVAALLEVHLTAMYATTDQVHVEAALVMAKPLFFLELIERHKVFFSFAPNFFLARALTALDGCTRTFDLRSLRYLICGGEICVFDTCEAFSTRLTKFGARHPVVVPGFGMTETCAGCIYNVRGHAKEVQQVGKQSSLSIGNCISGVQVRVKPAPQLDPALDVSSINANGIDGNPDPESHWTIGHLEIRGPAIFQSYLNNPEASQEAFPADGWFQTGDIARQDAAGNIWLIGRTKETMTINGVKHYTSDIERAIESAAIPGLAASYLCCFPIRSNASSTEQCCVVYQHVFSADDAKARYDTMCTLTRIVMLQIGSRPIILPLPAGVLVKSTLGKLSRAQIRKTYELHEYATYERLNDEELRTWGSNNVVQPSSDAEKLILDVVVDLLGLDRDLFGVTTSFFESGASSVDVIRIKRALDQRLGTDLSIAVLIANSTARSLVPHATRRDASPAYDPVVVLQPSGSGTPLWLVHPGVGEIMVFIGLTQLIRDRPVYALRARGFDRDDAPFRSIGEITATYVQAIRAVQPAGPYAIAGYSYGSMLAFEMAKTLQCAAAVPFVGCFNLPPHIRTRMRQLNWHSCLDHLALFLGLLAEEPAPDAAPAPDHLAGKQAAIREVVRRADAARWRELGLSEAAMLRWVDVAHALQRLAVDYEPSGCVAAMDVFYCEPLKVVAASKEIWLAEHLSRWRGFCATEPNFHAVEGAHYTMMSAAHVQTLQRTLQRALRDRGV